MDKERRRDRRRPSDIGVSFRKLAYDQFQAKMKDFSSTGANLVTEDPPRVGDLVELTAGSCRTAIGDVVYVRRRKQGGYRFGVRFINTAEADETAESEDWADIAKPRGMKENAFSYYERLEKLRQFVDEHLDESIPLSKAADIAAMEMTYFSSFFHDKVGITFREWLQYLRIKKATEQIRSTNCSITETAFNCGFGDLRTFERTFSKWLQMTPSAYKKLVTSK